MKRRTFLKSTGLGALFAAIAKDARADVRDFGPLQPDPLGYLELPKGFTYTILQKRGDPMSDSFTVPGMPDGMSCFDVDGDWVLLRNHELSKHPGQDDWCGGDFPELRFNPKGKRAGCVSRVVLDPETLAVKSSNLVLAGTDTNCGGGRTPWGWASCEESLEDEHGWVFLTDPRAATLQAPKRLDSLGRFVHEALVLDVDSGVTWMTEDHWDARFYRHVPDDPTKPWAGQLQALVIDGAPNMDTNLGIDQGAVFGVKWVRIGDPAATKTQCRAQGARLGAARFMRGEGICRIGDDVWFTASLGGPKDAGQLWRLRPSEQSLELVYVVTDRSRLSMPDNLVSTPWGEVLMAEDNYNFRDGATHQHLRLINGQGQVSTLARNVGTQKEFAGPCFSPDGTTLFVNIQRDTTLAIRGPFPT